MLFKTHLLFGILFGILALETIAVPHPILFLLLFAFFSIFPDIDSPHSKLGKKLSLLSWIISFVFGHRGFIHSIWIPLTLSILFWYNGLSYIAIAIFSGYLTHLFVDALTRGGIRFLWFGPRISGFFRTGGILEALVFLALAIILLVKIASFL